MIRNLSFLFLLSTATSCGIFQSHFGEPNYDPEIERNTRIALSNKKENKARDSVNNLIKSAPIAVPSNLHATTLIVETYNYDAFLKLQENKFYSPADSKQHRRWFNKYSKTKDRLLQDYKHPVIYAEKTSYDTLEDLDKYRYVLKTTYLIMDDENQVTIYNDGTAGGYVSSLTYYVYDRKSNSIYKGFSDIKLLTQ